MIEVNDSIQIDENELDFDFIRSSGPGGQNVNKVSSGVQLRFEVESSPSLPEGVRKRLRSLAGNRMTKEGVLIIDANQYRTQEQNRQDAIDRLVALVRQAAKKPKVRRRMKTPASQKQKRLEAKKRRSEKKRLRKSPRISDYF